MLIRYRAALMMVLVLASTPAYAAAVTVYRVTDLGFPPGTHYTHAWAMNGHGDIAGMFVGADGNARAFRWTEAGGLEDLGANGGYSSIAFAINDNGDVAGTYWDRDWQYHPFVSHPGQGLTDLRDRYPQIELIYGISNDGRLTGLTFSNRAFRTQPGGAFQELTSNFSFGAAINDSGDVTGVAWRSSDQTEPRHAFRYSDADGLVDLGALDGDGWSGGRAINQGGVVAGFSISADGASIHGFRASPGAPIEALAPSMEASPFAINNHGAIVGFASGPSGWGPFLCTDVMIELHNRMTITDQLAYQLGEAWAVNDAGQIMVHYYTPDGGGVGTVQLTPFEFSGPTGLPTANISVLWPPNDRMVAVTVDPHVGTDPFDDQPVCRVSRVVNSEGPANGFDPDVSIDGPFSVSLRATRLGSGPGRTYTLTIGCSDRTGASSVARVVVSVPHEVQ